MVGSKNMVVPGFSWADEVEKEEETRAMLHRQKKPNPFGSARPREVVLEEKGIDWRKLDRQLHQPSIISYVPRKEKMLEENIPAPVRPPVAKPHPLPPRREDIGQKAKDTKKGCNKRGSPLGFLSLQDQNSGGFVPPLRYPPKNTMVQLEEMQGSYNPYRLDVCQRNFQYQKHAEIRDLGLDHENENLIHEPGMQWFHNSKIMDGSCHIHQNERHLLLDELHIERERENMVRENRRRSFTQEELMKATHNVRTLKRSAVHEELEWQNFDSNYEGRKFYGKKLVGPPLVNGRRRAFDECGWEIMEGENGRRGGVGESLMGPPPIGTPGNGGRRWGHMDNHRTIRSVNEEIEWEKIEYENKRRIFAGNFVDHSMGAVGDGGGVEVHRNLEMENSGFGRNYKKRGMKSGYNNSHYHQRKRR